MENYKQNFIKKYGQQIWDNDAKNWLDRGYNIDSKTGLLKQINK